MIPLESPHEIPEESKFPAAMRAIALGVSPGAMSGPAVQHGDPSGAMSGNGNGVGADDGSNPHKFLVPRDGTTDEDGGNGIDAAFRATPSMRVMDQ